MTTTDIGFDFPARAGMSLEEISTPALIIDLQKFEHNVAVMRKFIHAAGIGLRAHAKTHKSVDIARYQVESGGAHGICCQKVSEAEVMVRGGITDILISNQVVAPEKIRRLVSLTAAANLMVCVDDIDNIAELSRAAQAQDTVLKCLVELDCGAGRCGVPPGAPVLELAEAIDNHPGLVFSGLQAYQGAAQHVVDYDQRKKLIEHAVAGVRHTLGLLSSRGFACEIVSGGGTGSYPLETESGVYTELQCGSYVFMDAHYQTIRGRRDQALTTFSNSLYVLSSINSIAAAGQAVCDAGLKAHSVDSGMPRIEGPAGLRYIQASDEHGVIDDPGNTLKLNDKLLLVPGHCDPTCNLYDWYVGVRDGRVETIWPVSARGKLY